MGTARGMSAGASTKHSSIRPHLRFRAALAAAVGLGLLTASLISGLTLGGRDRDVSTRVSSAAAGGTAERAESAPMIAITAWWSERAADAYDSPDAVHLGSCDDAGSIPTTEERLLLCSTLVEDLGDTRVYDSGRAGAPADVRITVVEQPDGTWAVTETLAR